MSLFILDVARVTDVRRRSAVQYLVNPSAASEQAAASGVSGKMQAVANAVEAAVGLDEPPTEMYSA